MNDKQVERSEIASLMESVLYEVKRIVVGQDHFLERVLVAMLAQGHLLVEGVSPNSLPRLLPVTQRVFPLGERLRVKREAQGLSRKRLAMLVRVDDVLVFRGA